MTVIIDIDHEAGNLSEWSTLSDPTSGLSADAAAGLAGTSYGMACNINDTTSFYAQATVSPDNTSGVVRIRFYFDPNSLTMTDGQNHFLGVMRSNVNIATFKIEWTSANGFAFQAQMVGDLSTLSTEYWPISDAPHYIEVRLVRASSSVAADGTLDLWIDGVHKEQLVGDNYDMFIYFRQLRLGATSGLDGGTSGTYYFDEIIINDDGSEIGAVGGGGGSTAVPVFVHQMRQQGMA
jgi:hypothetical protein